jgi:aryl-alcohol dehydrogenase-like predicted oxidoreductase
MEKRKLGTPEIEVSPFAFGGNVFGWTADEKTSHQLLDAFVAAGFNLIDTANSYSTWVPGNKGGESETLIGSWLKKSGHRNKVIIATKVGSDFFSPKKILKKDYILREAEASLKRLGIDCIDVYFSHYDDLDTPVEEPLEAYAQLIKEGKVKIIGASNFSAGRLQEALQASRQNGYPRYQVLQPLYNLYNREEYEKELEPFCLENKVGVMNYYALASGFLTGKYRSEEDLSKSKRGGGIKKYLTERGRRILEALDGVAEQYKATPAQISLAWLVARKSITAPIASATSMEQLNDLIKGIQLQLAEEAIETLNKASE